MKVWRDYRVTIPKKLRDYYGFTPGTEVKFIQRKGRLFLVKASTTK